MVNRKEDDEMKEYYIPELAKNVFSVGVKDWNRRMFDSLIPLPQGTTYNSYLIKGKGKTALIDTVNPGFEQEFIQRINQVSDAKKIDYVIMNHAEPDHASAIPVIMNESKNAVLITSEKGAKMAQTFFDVPAKRIKTVKDGDILELGGKTLQFIDAPWLHWPETMFTFVQEDKILFPCDFFGAHTAAGIFDDDVDELIPFAKRYYGEIMMPFNRMGSKAMDKIKDFDIRMIAPSHGPIYKNPERIINVYKRWTRGETKDKAIVVYVSMWKSTEKMINALTERLLAHNIQVSKFDLVNADIGDIARELVDARAIVLGVPTVLGGMHPLGIYASYLVKALRPPLQYAVVLSSYGWAGGALRQVSDILGPTGLEILGTHKVNGPPKEKDYQKSFELGEQLAKKIKA